MNRSTIATPTTTKVITMRIPLTLLSGVIAISLVGCGDEQAKKPAVTPNDDRATTYERQNTAPNSTTTGPTNNPVATPAADNTTKNERDDGTTLTPLDQSMSEADTAITAAVRSAVIAEPKMSVNAQNTKIITQDGVVTLRGPVASSAERTTISTIAERTPGVKRVDNQLEVVRQ